MPQTETSKPRSFLLAYSTERNTETHVGREKDCAGWGNLLIVVSLIIIIINNNGYYYYLYLSLKTVSFVSTFSHILYFS